MANTQANAKMKIAHVLVMDVVGYSTLLIDAQTAVLAELNRIVRETPRFHQAEAENKLLRLPTGDGMALVFFDDTEAPIECAMQISAAIRDQSKIRLRMGIHSGPVNPVEDVNDRPNGNGLTKTVEEQLIGSKQIERKHYGQKSGTCGFSL